ncbi:hypothetical protein Pint_33091 [Pistacia integerrima]|uniref:Uncharacterized protein n=1 Tax=Pistacia integerrima TaxID=434235 RepID=A0ACC0X3R2_9ROSI|nr:hypothetical protein Pint_33091 [Pistacia integerrima]
MKVMKKLKFWSRKKRKKEHSYDYDQHQPYYCPHYHQYYCSCTSSTPQPSAPPLPPWLESDETECYESYDYVPSQTQLEYSEEDVEETSPICPELKNSESSESYQQYLAPNPAYGLPVTAESGRRERRSGFFGCAAGFGFDLFRCFFPCFHIREVSHEKV